jgi:hypothetical protein
MTVCRDECFIRVLDLTGMRRYGGVTSRRPRGRPVAATIAGGERTCGD